MNILPVLHLTAALIYINLVVFVLSKNPRSPVNIVSSLFILCFAVWNFGDALLHFSQDRSIAMFWENMGSFGWIGFAGFFLWQTAVLTGRKKLLKSFLFYLAVFAVPAVLIYAQWTGRLINDLVRQPYGWGVVWSESFWTVSYYIYYVTYIIVSFLLLLNYRRKTGHRYRQKQAAVIILTASVVAIAGTVTNVALPQLGNYDLPPVAPLLSLIWAGGLTLAVTKYGLMSINPATAASDIIATMADALLLLNPEGNIAEVNTAAETLLGYRRVELLGRPVEMILSSGSSLFKGPEFEKLFEKSSVKDVSLRCRRKTGEDIPVSFSVTVMRDREDSLVGLVCVFYDLRPVIEKNIKIEESYRHQMKLREKLNKSEKLAMIGTLAGGVAHEIRTPLSSVKNAVFFLERYSGPLDDETQNYIGIMRRELARAEEIISSLLDFSRASVIKPETVSIEKLFDETVEELGKRKNISIVKKISGDASRIQADPEKLKKLFKNIVKNSFQAIEGQGIVEIETFKVGHLPFQGPAII